MSSELTGLAPRLLGLPWKSAAAAPVGGELTGAAARKARWGAGTWRMMRLSQGSAILAVLRGLKVS